MTAQASSHRPAPRPLYEYRGNRPEAPAPAVPLDLKPQASVRPLCSSCSGPVDRVLGGWWCASCETASA